jgi:hypothetical protein
MSHNKNIFNKVRGNEGYMSASQQNVPLNMDPKEWARRNHEIDSEEDEDDPAAEYRRREEDDEDYKKILEKEKKRKLQADKQKRLMEEYE